jgi:hypothetical protein
LLLSLGALCVCTASRPREQFQAAADFIFERKPFHSNCAPPPRGAHGYLIAGSQLPFRRVHSEHLAFPLSEVPSLTLTADESNMIYIAGGQRDHWSLDFCAVGDGNTESEALDRLKQTSMERTGDTVSLNNSGDDNTRFRPNDLAVTAPVDAPIVVHASFAGVRVEDMAASVRITAIHGRATILDTTGKVDASGFAVDFAGSEGKVRLSSEDDINLKFRAARFKGSLMAWAQGPVRVLVPPAFQTAFQAVVNRPQDFACRADICSKITMEHRGALTVFTYAGDGSASPSAFHLRSELQTVVIDNAKQGL